MTRRKKRKPPVFKEDCRYNCGRKVNFPQSRTCTACYSGIYYWMRKGVTAALERQEKLVVLQRRIADVTGVTRIEAGRQIRGKKRAASR